ncbi:uncharacterized protein LOC115985470 [Quercus lobata]|uniref:uncharacterized protein LOC115985470 n=1 Tax=Quercus lobata TaxID=97700 RepID=UPI001246F174|nr:uncharacterized protein LOC115985470 [Quercus lobata]
MDPIPSLSKIYSLLIQEETHRSIPNASVVKVDYTIFAAKVSTNHVTHGSNFANSGGKGKDRPICTHCCKTSHTVDKGYKLHGFPPRFKFKNKPSIAHQVSSGSDSDIASPLHQSSAFTPEQCQQLLALFGVPNSSLPATPHASESPMANVASSSNSTKVAMAVDLLTSIADLTSWKTIRVGKTLDGLYLLQLDSLQQSSSSSLAAFLAAYNINDVFSHFTATISTRLPSQSFSIWHARLGHPSDVRLNTLCHVIPSLQPSCNKDCKICPMAKLKRFPFPFHNKISNCAFDLVHMDVWGPNSTPTLDDFKYYLTVVDDATRAT